MVDCDLEVLLWCCIEKVFFDDVILGEEDVDWVGLFGWIWVVDLLDGMINFLFGVFVWVVSIVCEDFEGVLVGCVLDFFCNEFFIVACG